MIRVLASLPTRLPTVALPDTVNVASVPTCVMAVWLAVVSVPVKLCARTLPVVLMDPNEPWIAMMLPAMLKYSVPAPVTLTLPTMVCSAPGMSNEPTFRLPRMPAPPITRRAPVAVLVDAVSACMLAVVV